MKRLVLALLTAVAAGGTLVVGQTGDVERILAEARVALGGEKALSAVKTVSIKGQVSRVVGKTATDGSDIEIAIELPDKFVKTVVAIQMAGVTRTASYGFNGDTAIERRNWPAAPSNLPGPSPEQQAADRRRRLLDSRQDFVRLTLGMQAASFAACPLRLASGGQVVSPDIAADIVDVTGEDGLAMRLFVDKTTRLPRLVTWMDREPMVSRSLRGSGPGSLTQTADRGAVFTADMGLILDAKPADRDRLMKQLEDRRNEARAALRLVEYRLYYEKYTAVDGVKVPFRCQLWIDGKRSEETVFKHVTINAALDRKTFQAK
jgi:hypothetical protein